MLDKLSNRFQYLDSLIRKRATGSPKDLADRLGISERAWYKLRDQLINDLGLPLAYDSHQQTYYYTEEGQLIFGFQRKLSTDDMEKLEGGRLLRLASEEHGGWLYPISSFTISQNFLSLNF